MENILDQNTTEGSSFKWWKIPVTMGLLIALIKIVLSTIQYKYFVESWGSSTILFAVNLIAGLGLLFYTIVLQRKARGGYMDIKQAFQAVFVSIIILVALTTIYDQVYMTLIDPGVVDKMLNASLAMAQKYNAPQEKLDEIAEQLNNKNSFNLGRQLLGFCMSVVMYSIAGIIMAAIAQKKKPVF